MKNRSAIVVTALVAAVVAVVLYFAFSGNEDNGGASGDNAAVRIGTFSTAIDYAPYIVAKQKGWLKESLDVAGASYETTVFQSLAPINEAFAAGRIDVMFMAEPPVLVGRGAGIDSRIVAMSASLQQEILVAPDSPIKTVADLKGTNVAVLAGSSSNYSLVKMAKAEGLTERDLEIVDMIPPDAKPAFRSGHVDAWAVWSPWVEQEVIDGTGRIIPGSDAKVHSIIAMRGGFIDNQPELAKAVVSTIDRARQWIRDNPEEAMSIVAKELSLAPAVVEMAWPKHDWTSELDEAVTRDIQAKADFLKEKRFIRQQVDVASDVITPISPE